MSYNFWVQNTPTGRVQRAMNMPVVTWVTTSCLEKILEVDGKAVSCGEHANMAKNGQRCGDFTRTGSQSLHVDLPVWDRIVSGADYF